MKNCFLLFLGSVFLMLSITIACNQNSETFSTETVTGNSREIETAVAAPEADEARSLSENPKKSSF